MSSEFRFETNSADQTRLLGRRLAASLPPAGVIVLTGDLGSGKTTLVQGIAEGLGVARAEDVASPTFTLIHEYGDPVQLYHIDLYRLETASEAEALGLDDIFSTGALVLIEWGERFPVLLPEGHGQLRLEHTGDERRIISYVPPCAVAAGNREPRTG